ncbi:MULTISPECIES: sodium:proton antiporter [unclassified Caballeronia]|uniref:cation:proton antiporter n=1 Tax=unclassified Caballeronia TaxID=2646786 RepID=UPI001F19BB4B|nr:MULTISPECIES: sodium:proton antiporter [unclassified Caballeronia]MCE4547929.1 sodium:proton antiporter [Caballeronia sp. PC1]MCE4575818.1 sodium:proton antiporter [Caballeronia sp. CLC5]
MLDIVAISISMTAVLAYLNHRFIRLPTTIGVMATSLGVTFLLVVLDGLGWDVLGFVHGLKLAEAGFLHSVDFSQLLLQGMLSLLLFAGAMHVDFARLANYRWQVLALAIVSTSVSTAVVGVAIWLLLPLLDMRLSLPYCLVFGALISPTDPIAVMGILRSAGAPRNLEIVITGESLFNDGVGVVLFSLMLALATSGDAPSVSSASLILLREAGGGIAFGWVLGYALYRLLASVDHYQIEVLLTLAAVLGGYSLASHLEISGPLAMVIAGVMTGNRSREHAMSETTRHYVDMFWELIDEILNALLFVLIGMQALIVPFTSRMILAGVVAYVIALAARLLTVGAPIAFFRRAAGLPRGSWLVLTWGGLRGGISVALALSLPSGDAREVILAMTYLVVMVSIFGQGLTIGRIVRKSVCQGEPAQSMQTDADRC